MAGSRRRRGPTPQNFLDWFPVVVRYTGVAIAVYAALVYETDRPSLYVLAAGMMGGEPLLRWWARARDGNGS